MAFKLTKKEVVKEILKSGKDSSYFINNYCRISHPMKGLIQFKTYPYQDNLLVDYNDFRFNVILKARQLGISTITAAYCVWFMLFHKEKNIVVLATKFSTASNLVKKVKSIMKNLPEWMKIAQIDVDNRTSFELSNGSIIKAVPTSEDAGRSEALSLLVVDEAAHIEKMDDIWTAVYSTLATGGRCIALSTPKGTGNWFHKTYTGAVDGDNEFNPIELMWDVHPERDQAWFEKETKNMSKRQIAQELLCNFNTSGDTVVHPDDLNWINTNLKDPIYRTGYDRNFWIWEKHEADNQYLLAADVARGDGADNSVFHILKLNTMEVVAEYQGKPSLDMYSRILYDAGIEYGGCLLVVENNGIGISILEKLIDLGYPNLYYSMKSTHEFVEAYQGESLDKAIPGFSTTTKTRPLVVAKLEEFIRNKMLTTYSSRFYHELKTFIWNNGKPQAMRSYNDDLVMSMAIGCWIRDTALQVNKRELEYKKALVNSMYMSKNIMNTAIKGMEGYNETTKEKIQDFKEEMSSFPWIYKG
tara:strand:+ start:159 stop:1742 length:1584 start_codon:yes stop_codon:yes gene_type:complete